MKKGEKFKNGGFTSDELTLIRKKAESFSLRSPAIRKKDLVQEFGSYVMIEAIEGRYKRFNWMLTDFLRQEFGRIIDGSPSAVISAKLSCLSMDGVLCKKDRKQLNLMQSPLIHGEEIAHLLPASLSQKERAILLLFYKWGINQRELGEAFKVSESMICQIMKVALQKVRESMENQSRI